MVASIGFALLLAQMPSINLYAQSPIHKTVNKDSKKTTTPNFYQISGKVLDEKKEPLIGAVVQVSVNGIVKGGAATDYDGNYIIKPLAKGNYTVKIQYSGYYAHTSHVTLGEANAVKNVQLKINPKQLDEVRVVGYKVPLIMGGNFGRTIQSEEIEKMGGRSGGSYPMATTAGVYQKSADGGLNITGARDAGTTYIIDGTMVRPAKPVSKFKRAWIGIKKLFN